MKKTNFRFLALLMSLAMTLSLLAVPAAAYDERTDDPASDSSAASMNGDNSSGTHYSEASPITEANPIVETNAAPASLSIPGAMNIYVIRELDEQTIEVFLESGVIITVDKAAISDYASSVVGYTPGIRLNASSDKMDDADIALVLGIFPKLVETLVTSGRTRYPSDMLTRTNERFKPLPAAELMVQNRMEHHEILQPQYEALRGSATKATAVLSITHGNLAAKYHIGFEFIGPDDTGDDMTVYTLTSAADFACYYGKTRFVSLTRDAWTQVILAPEPPVEPTPQEPVPVVPDPVPAPLVPPERTPVPYSEPSTANTNSPIHEVCEPCPIDAMIVSPAR